MTKLSNANSWYTKYRPKKISELHLKTVRDQLQKLVGSGRFPRALLFAGPKGTGKTSSSRILAAVLNDPNNEKIVREMFFEQKAGGKLKDPDSKNDLVQKIQRGSSFVVQEMDAASNRGIDDVRALKERIGLPPQEGVVSVYILDEVHMLTTEAFNALLKILEEPPAHVVFILATTELHKIPETIVSRCRLIKFTTASTSELIDALQIVVKAEKLDVAPEVLNEIAILAAGSFRDAIKILEQAADAGDKIDLETVHQLSGGDAAALVIELVESVLKKEELLITKLFATLREQKIDQKYFHLNLLEYLYSEYIKSLEGKETKYPAKISLFLLNEFQSVELKQRETIPLLGLELSALNLISKSKQQSGPASGTSKKKVKNINKVTSSKVTAIETETFEPAPMDFELEVAAPPTYSQIVPETLAVRPLDQVSPALDSIQNHNPGQASLLVDNWTEFMKEVGQNNLSLELLLRSAKPMAATGNQLSIGVYYSFHQEQLNQAKFVDLLKKSAISMAGGDVSFKFVVNDDRTKDTNMDTANVKPVANTQLEEMAKQVLV